MSMRVSLLALAAAPVAVSAFSAPMPVGALARASALCSGPIAPARRSTLALRMSSSEPRTNNPEEDAAYPLPDNVSREDFLTLRKEGMGPTTAVSCEPPSHPRTLTCVRRALMKHIISSPRHTSVWWRHAHGLATQIGIIRVVFGITF